MIKCRNIIYLVTLSTNLFAQTDIPIGSWRTHYSFRDAHSVAVTENGVFCAGSNSLFFFDFQDQSLNRIGKIDGLSDTQITTIDYHGPLKTLVIAYRNGNIDLLTDNLVVNIKTILEAPTGSSKFISHIAFNQNLAYLSTDFGMVVLDLDKEEVKEAYTNIGEGGAEISIQAGTIFNDSLFLATSEGVQAGSLAPGNNLQDFNNWTRFDSSRGIPGQVATAIASNDHQLLASIDGTGIYNYQNGSWKSLNYQPDQKVRNMTSGTSPLLVTLENKLLSIDESLNVEELSDPIYPNPQSSVFSSSGLWIADSINGLITPLSPELTSLFPSGPFSDSTFHVTFQGNAIFAMPHGYGGLGNPLRSLLGFNLFREGMWTSYNSSGFSETQTFPAIKDLVDVTHNRQNGKFYFASFGEGLVEWDPEGGIRVLDESTPGSTLQNILPGGRNVLVSCVTSSENGNIWAVNFGNSSSIHRFNPEDDTWTAYPANFDAGRYPLDLQQAENGDLWLRLDPNHGGGIMVFNPESAQQKHLTNIQGQGGLPSRQVRDLEIDGDGQIWVATDRGVSRYPFPIDILENPVVNASPVLFEGRPLFLDQEVNSISTDPGNRKWIGTNEGVWLFSEQGDSLIYHFTIDDSPLPSNRVQDISINQESGEVFMVTDLGLVSFRGTSTEGRISHQKVRIFPNPVTREFNGLVGISGLSANAIVKIADVTGKLVKEFRAAGGTAVWDIRNYQGNRVESGVYLVFSSSPNGNETFIGKIAVIN